MKYIIYGKGKFFKNKKNIISWEQVVAIADKQAGEQELFENVPVILPSAIDAYEYDYIVVFSRQLYKQISQELQGMYYIPQDKIVSWKVFEQRNKITLLEDLSFFSQFISEYNVKTVLDTDIRVLPDNVYSKEELVRDFGMLLEGIGSCEFPTYNQLYDSVYASLEECKDEYDLLLFWDWNADIIKGLSRRLNKSKYMLLFIQYSKVKALSGKDIKSELSSYGKVQLFSTVDGFWYMVDLSPSEEKLENAQIYVVTHKKYNLLSNELYVPICVGNVYRDDAFLNENDGENIAYLNEKINECTALYWIWKNTINDYVGLCHYRRYFYNNALCDTDNILNSANLAEYLKEYDILLAHSKNFECSVEEQLQETIPDKEAFELGRKIVLDLLAKRQPEYLSAYEAVMKKSKFFHCNMFVTRREVFDAYCEWLFSFLMEAAEKMDISGYDNYSKRVIGFLAERMLTVWLMKQDLKIKELPITRWE